jgi:hypothetical protein
VVVITPLPVKVKMESGTTIMIVASVDNLVSIGNLLTYSSTEEEMIR